VRHGRQWVDKEDHAVDRRFRDEGADLLVAAQRAALQAPD